MAHISMSLGRPERLGEGRRCDCYRFRMMPVQVHWNSGGNRSKRREVSHSSVCSWEVVLNVKSMIESNMFLFQGPEAPLDLGRVLGGSSRPCGHPYLLRLLSCQEVHGRLPDLHQLDEREDSAPDRSQQSLCVQAHLQLEGDRSLRRHRALCYPCKSGHDAEWAVQVNSNT